MTRIGNLFTLIILIILNFSLINNFAVAKQKQEPPKAFYKAGEHYQILAKNLCYGVTAALEKSNYKPTVIMFFSYGCYGCRQLTKAFNDWAKLQENKIDIYHYPVAYNRPWENLAKLYYVHQELFPNSNGEELFEAIFDNNQKLWLEAEMLDFYAKRHIPKELFVKKYNSFVIDSKVKKAIDVSNNYKIMVTPNIIIHGKKKGYMLNFTMVQDPDTLFKVADYLLKENPVK